MASFQEASSPKGPQVLRSSSKSTGADPSPIQLRERTRSISQPPELAESKITPAKVLKQISTSGNWNLESIFNVTGVQVLQHKQRRMLLGSLGKGC
jgi:hypothetical protein